MVFLDPGIDQDTDQLQRRGSEGWGPDACDPWHPGCCSSGRADGTEGDCWSAAHCVRHSHCTRQRSRTYYWSVFPVIHRYTCIHFSADFHQQAKDISICQTVFMPLFPLELCWRHFFFRLSMHASVTERFITWYFTNHWWNFIRYNTGFLWCTTAVFTTFTAHTGTHTAVRYCSITELVPSLDEDEVGHKNAPIRYRGQKVQGQGHSETTHLQISILGGIFLPVARICGYILMIRITVTQYHVPVTWWHFQGHGFKGRGHRKHSWKCTFPAEILVKVNMELYSALSWTHL